jgi:hypothetical protein
VTTPGGETHFQQALQVPSPGGHVQPRPRFSKTAIAGFVAGFIGLFIPTSE